jgi:hypothetical protein
VATGRAGAGGARAEDLGEMELPEVKPRLEAARRSLVRSASFKCSAKGESGYEERRGGAMQTVQPKADPAAKRPTRLGRLCLDDTPVRIDGPRGEG